MGPMRPLRPMRPIRRWSAVSLLGLGAFASASLSSGSAHALGSGSGSAAAFEGIGYVLGVISIGGVVVLTVVDAKAAADHKPVSNGLAAGQAILGGGFAAIVAYGYAGGFDKKPDGSPNPVPWWGLAIFSVGAAAGGYGIATLAAKDGAVWWGYGAATGTTTLAFANAVGTISGAPRYAETSTTQAILAVPGIAVGLIDAARSDGNRAERTAGFALTGVSGLLALHGVLDASLGTHFDDQAPPTKAATWSVSPTFGHASCGVAFSGLF